MSTARRLNYSYGQYLRALEDSGIKLEFWDGDIYAMAGGTPEHSALAMRLGALLGTKLPKGCRVFGSDAKVRIPHVDAAVFPDVSVVCGKLMRAEDDELSIANPGIIVEITSPSTDSYDRGDKLKAYKTLKSVQAIWLVSQTPSRVTALERVGGSWKTTEHGHRSRLTLAKPALSIDVDEIYSVLDDL